MNIEPLEILKWIGIVLAAGFVGYFGRYLAIMLIDRLKKKEKPAGSAAARTIPSRDAVQEKTALKIDKKQAKAEAKRIKKGGREIIVR